MKKYLGKTLIATACGLAMSAGANAATVAFEHADPNEFRDIRATNESQKKFEEGVIRELEEQFRNKASALPEGQTLQVTLKDIDLAGDVEYFHRWYPFGLRVIRNVDIPRMEFSYVLRDASGEVISSGEEKLTDLGFRNRALVDRQVSPLDYEKRLISDWYDETFG